MAYFNACILVKDDGENINVLEKKAVELTNKFDLNLEVAEYQDYFPQGELDLMSEEYGTSSLEILVTKVEDWNGEEKAGFDNNGLYAVTTSNPNGHFDRGEIDAFVPHEKWMETFVKTNNLCNAIITPEEKWISGPYIYSDSDPKTKKKMDEWVSTIQDTLEKYKDCAAFSATLHS
jgi:hypothetical protein